MEDDLGSNLIARVSAVEAWAINGLVFEFFDGHREGILLDEKATACDLIDREISRRDGEWITVRQPGGYITEVAGFQVEKSFATPQYLCHSLSLKFASGQVISFGTGPAEWKGNLFSVEVPTDSFYMNKLKFEDGQCIGLEGLQTTDHKKVLRTPSFLSLASESPEQESLKENSTSGLIWKWVITFLFARFVNKIS